MIGGEEQQAVALIAGLVPMLAEEFQGQIRGRLNISLTIGLFNPLGRSATLGHEPDKHLGIVRGQVITAPNSII